MKNSILAPLGLAALLAVSLPAATYDYDDPSTNRSLRLYVPDGQDTIRGILLNGNGAGGDSTAEADAPLKQAWVDKHGFAILATAKFGRFQDGTSGEDWRVLTEGLAALAADSGHGELTNAPFLCWGYSNGGQMAYGLARLLGDRVIAFIVNKGGYYIGAPHGTDPYNIPALFFSGEADKDYRRDAIEGLYQDGRDNNARWTWIEEYKTGHGVRNSESMAFAFFEQVLPLRYPEDANNLPTPDAAPSLTSLPLDSGWLVDEGAAAWSSGYLSIRAAAGFAGDATTKGWVPNEATARLYRSMASHSSDTAYYHLEKGVRIDGPYPAEEPPSPSSLGLYSITDPVTLEGEITTPSGWDRMEIFDGGDLVATVDGVARNFSIPLDLDEDRNLNAVYAELVYPDGTRYTSHILWLVSREAPVLLDPPDDLSASAASVDAIALQWTDIANKESGYQLQRLKVEQLGDPVEVPAPDPVSGEWTYAPSVSGRQELSLEVTRRPDGATRVPVEVRHANGLTVTYLNQSNHGPVESSWDFRDEPDGNSLLEVADNGSNGATWSSSLSGTETNNGVLRLRSTDGATTWAGGGALGYTSGTMILEVTLDGWNAIGSQRDQSLEITFNTGNNNVITAGMVLQQNSSGFGLWGWALGSGSSIGSASNPVRQYPDSYDGPVTFRVVADFDSRSYELLYKDPTTADSFVSGGTGTIDPGRDGGSIRMQVEGDWTDAGEYLDFLRVRLLPPPPAAADDPVWVDLGVYEMQTDSTVSILSGDTLGSVEAGTLRLVPFAESAWTDLPSLPADSSSFVDAGLEPGTTYRYRVRAVEGGNSGDWSNEAEATAIATAESYSEWAQQFDWNGADDAPEATPLKDGMSNLLKFAFGGTPTSSAASLMPAIDAVMEGGKPVPVFSFRRRQGQGAGSPTEGYSVHGITYVVEISPDLSPGSWVSGSGDLVEVDPPEDNGDGTETVRIRPAADLTTQPANFLRLRVEQP